MEIAPIPIEISIDQCNGTYTLKLHACARPLVVGGGGKSDQLHENPKTDRASVLRTPMPVF